MADECNGQHRFFVADCAVVELEGKVVVIAVCTACGQRSVSTHKVVGDAVQNS